MSYSLGEILGKKGYIRGPFGSALKRSEMLDSGIPVYEQQNAIYNNREFRFFINQDKFEEMKRFTVQEGDIIVSCSGTVGKTTLIMENDPIGIISQALLILRPNKHKTDSRFLKYFLDSKEGQEGLLARAHGSVQTNIAKRQDVETLMIPEFSLKHQKTIANILSSLDDKIELNNKINKNLEELAQTLYKQWFVDFEFPNEDGLPYKSSGGEMVDSELGMIPKNWGVKQLDKYLNFERGIEPGSKNYIETSTKGAIPFYRVGDMLNQDKVNYVYEEHLKGKRVKKGEVLVSFDGALGRIAMNLEGSYSTGMRKVFSKKDLLTNEFIYVLFKSLDIQNTIETFATGTTILHASSAIKHLVMPYNQEIVCKFTEIIKPMIRQILNILNENKKLAETRDLLLPKLMSGEIRIPLKE